MTNYTITTTMSQEAILNKALKISKVINKHGEVTEILAIRGFKQKDGTYSQCMFNNEHNSIVFDVLKELGVRVADYTSSTSKDTQENKKVESKKEQAVV